MANTFLAVITICCLVGIVEVACGQTNGEAILTTRPLTIAASTVGRFSKGASWYLSINSAGQAEVHVGRGMSSSSPPKTQKKFQITQQQIDELEQSLEREDFFRLAPEQGESVTDGSWDSLTIVSGDQSHTVRIGYLMNWVHSDQEKLREPARALRVFRVVRSWFNEPGAVDQTQYDQMVLDAVPK